LIGAQAGVERMLAGLRDNFL